MSSSFVYDDTSSPELYDDSHLARETTNDPLFRALGTLPEFTRLEQHKLDGGVDCEGEEGIGDGEVDIIDNMSMFGSDDSGPPPPYTTLPPNPVDLKTSLGGQGNSHDAEGRPSIRLRHADFVPRRLARRMWRNDLYETYECLIDNANTWLSDHPGIVIVSCETVTWCHVKHRVIQAEATAGYKSMDARRSTCYLRGLRLWYFMDTFTAPHRGDHCAAPQIKCHTFIPSRRENLRQLISRVNNLLSNAQIGHIFSVETIRVKLPNSSHVIGGAKKQAQRCYWTEIPDMTKRYMLCFRLYSYLDTGDLTPATLDYKDFVCTQKSVHGVNCGYELFRDIAKSTSRWVALKHGATFINFQTLRVKLKRGTHFNNRSIFTEQMCATQRLNFCKGRNRPTRYLTILRVYYVTDTCDRSTARPQPPIHLTYKTFTPRVVAPPASSSVTSHRGVNHEDIHNMTDRINDWLQATGARLFGIETVYSEASYNKSPMDPEMTFYRHANRGQIANRVVLHVRVYLDGEYNDVSDDSTNSDDVTDCEPLHR